MSVFRPRHVQHGAAVLGASDVGESSRAITQRLSGAIMSAHAPARRSPGHLVQQGQKLATMMFLDQRHAGNSLGITSPIGGEGKTLLAAAIALSLSLASRKRTVLVETNWRHPSLHEFFDLPATPGLAEWLRGECDEQSIQHPVSETLLVVPAGSAHDDELLLIERLHASGGISILRGPDDFLVVDLPSVLSTSFGRLAARLVDALVVVAQEGVTPLTAIVDTCDTLHDLAVRGVVLNQVEHWIPQWIERLL